MDKERSRLEDPLSVKNKKESPTDIVNSDSIQPLILKQNPKNVKGTKSLPYDFNAETYEVYTNLKNPFMVGILAAETDKVQLDPIKAQVLFQQIEKKMPYSLEYPLNISAHRKRKLSNVTKSFSEDAESETEIVESESKLKMAPSAYLPREKLKENKRKLNNYIKGFFSYVLKRLSEDPGELAQVINEIVPLFVEHQIRVRFYKAFCQIRRIDDLNITLEKISKDVELENFELFCSALFVFYSSQK